jgi:hypothetical protein
VSPAAFRVGMAQTLVEGGRPEAARRKGTPDAHPANAASSPSNRSTSAAVL